MRTRILNLKWDTADSPEFDLAALVFHKFPHAVRAEGFSPGIRKCRVTSRGAMEKMAREGGQIAAHIPRFRGRLTPWRKGHVGDGGPVQSPRESGEDGGTA